MFNKEKTEVTFEYSFGTPHRICICLPQASKKCLVDAKEDGIAVSWSDHDLTAVFMGAMSPPRTEWFIDIKAGTDGRGNARDILEAC